MCVDMNIFLLFLLLFFSFVSDRPISAAAQHSGEEGSFDD